MRFPPVEDLLHRSPVEPVQIELPCVVEYQAETYRDGTVIHMVKAPWSVGVYMGSTKGEALAEAQKSYRTLQALNQKR